MLIAGDVTYSAGSRSYLREMYVHLNAMNQEHEVQLHMFQFRLDDRACHRGYVEIDDFPKLLRMASQRLYRWLPRVFYRIYERLVLFSYFSKVLKTVSKEDVLIVCGVIDGLHLMSKRLPENTWWLKLGVIEEEGTGGLRFKVRKKLESLHARFKHRIVVSRPMADFLDAEYGAARGGVLVLPCLVDLERFPEAADRNMLRKKLGLDEKFVMSYVGTASHWQCVNETVALFRKLREMREDCFFWVFTPDRQAFETLLADLPVDCWQIEYRPHHELAHLLPAADVACLLRRKELLNRVSSPLKLPEYLACGLPVLIGPQVGQYSGLVAEKHLGVIIDPEQLDTWNDALEQMLRLRDEDSELARRCRDAAQSLSWQGYGSQLQRLLGHSED